MRNYRGELSECTTANLFIVKNGAALTPPLESGLLPGITREFLFEIGKDVGESTSREQVLRDEDLLSADEAFLTSTTREAVPIVNVDDRTIGSGRPGRSPGHCSNGFRRGALRTDLYTVGRYGYVITPTDGSYLRRTGRYVVSGLRPD